jgi:hypothetical protein
MKKTIKQLLEELSGETDEAKRAELQAEIKKLEAEKDAQKGLEAETLTQKLVEATAAAAEKLEEFNKIAAAKLLDDEKDDEKSSNGKWIALGLIFLTVPTLLFLAVKKAKNSIKSPQVDKELENGRG